MGILYRSSSTGRIAGERLTRALVTRHTSVFERRSPGHHHDGRGRRPDENIGAVCPSRTLRCCGRQRRQCVGRVGDRNLQSRSVGSADVCWRRLRTGRLFGSCCRGREHGRDLCCRYRKQSCPEDRQEWPVLDGGRRRARQYPWRTGVERGRRRRWRCVYRRRRSPSGSQGRRERRGDDGGGHRQGGVQWGRGSRDERDAQFSRWRGC